MRRFGSTPSDSLCHAGHRVDHVVHALALERGHRLQAYRLAVLLDLLDRVLGDRGQFLAAVRPVAADVEQQPARRAGLPEDGQAGQLLQRLQGRAALADQVLQPARRPPRPSGGRRRPARRCRRRSRGCRAGPRCSRRRSRSAGTGRRRRRPSSPGAAGGLGRRRRLGRRLRRRRRPRRAWRSSSSRDCSARGMLVSVTVSSPYSLGRTVGSAGFPGPAGGRRCPRARLYGQCRPWPRGARSVPPGAGRHGGCTVRTGRRRWSGGGPGWSALPLGGAALLRVAPAWRPASGRRLRRGRLDRRLAAGLFRPNRPPDLAGCTGLAGGGGAGRLGGRIGGGGYLRSTHCCWPRVKRLLVTQ